MHKNIYDWTLHEARQALRDKTITSVELTEAVFARIETTESSVDAFITLLKEEALESARTADAAFARGEDLGDLHGVPIAIKDNMCTKDILTTCASNMMGNFRPPYDATVVTKLKAAGAVIVGKTNMDEFAMGSSTENSAFKTTKNPWNLSCVPGGSSGGSAASVAAGQAFASLGSDTGGSIRQPASLCGLVGLKPTYGLVSRYGLVAFASSLDQIGPFSKDVEDCAIMMNAIAGYDELDGTSIDMGKHDYKTALVDDVKGMRIGLPKEFFGEGIAPEVKEAVYAAAKVYESLGAFVEEISLPNAGHALPIYYIIASSECSSNLARFDGVRYGYRAPEFDDFNDLFLKSRTQGFGEEVKRRIMLGTYALSSGYYDAYYNKAMKVRTLLKRDFDKAFENVDVLLTPTSPTVAFKIGEKTDNPLEMYMSDICTVPINIAGVPALSMQCGFSEGLPIGMQLIGRHFDEKTILRAAYAFERHTGYAKRRASL
jgi:aspartyl-tRNA(Asn)/glutamyl-tRNA(Gln) amidotransferase subunit A